MTLRELITRLNNVPAAALDQEVIIESHVSYDDLGVLELREPVSEVLISNSNYYLTPNGLLPSDKALAQYYEAVLDMNEGVIDEKELQEFLPMKCPVLIKENQVVLRVKMVEVTLFPSLPDEEPETVTGPHLWGPMGVA